jgi:tetratricopeptide (TPR) repeat protein
MPSPPVDKRDARPLMPFPAKDTRGPGADEPRPLGLTAAEEATLVDSTPKAPAIEPDWPVVDIKADLAAGDLAYSRGDFRTAEMLYAGTAEDARFHPEAWYKLGATRLMLGKVDGAIDAWRHALALDPDNDAMRAKLEKLYELRARMVKYKTLEPPKGPVPPEMRLIGAEDLINAGRPAAALLEIDAVAAARPGSADVALARGNALVALGRYDEAAESYRLAMAAEPEWARPLKALGDVYRRMGEERVAHYYYELFVTAAERSSRAEDAADVPAVHAILGH